MADFSMSDLPGSAESSTVRRAALPADADYKAAVSDNRSQIPAMADHILKMQAEDQESLRSRDDMIRILDSKMTELVDIIRRSLFAKTPPLPASSPFNGNKPDV